MHTVRQLPSAFPDIQWLAGLIHCDALLLDDVSPFNRKTRVHRGKIRNVDGYQWIYMPVHPEDRKKPLHLARTDTTSDWTTPLLRSLEYAYRNSIYFDFYEPEIRQDFAIASQNFFYIDAIRHLNNTLWKHLELHELPDPRRLSQSSQDINSAASLSNVNFVHPKYRQHFGGFIEGCCLYDVLFEVGPEFWRIYESLMAARES
jgi:hypothetical protein